MGFRALPPFASLRGRLLFLACLATFPALLFTFFLAARERAAALARTERDALHFARLASREHAHQIRGARDLLRWLGGRLAREGGESAALADPGFLSALLAGHPQLANVGVLSPDGRVLASARPLPRAVDWSGNPAFRAALRSDDVAAGTYLISPIFERPTLNHALAVRDAGGRVRAVLFNGLDLEWLAKIAREAGPPGRFALLITDREGRILAGGEGAGWAGDRVAGVAEAAASGRGRMLSVEGTRARRYFVAAPLEGADGLYAAVALPYGEALGEASAAFYRTLATLGVLTLFTLAVAFFSMEFGVLRALRALAGAVRRFGAGDASARAAVPPGHDELASLAGDFNAMADALAARQREAAAAQEELRALAGRLQAAREAEAARISRELHDEIGQLLTALKLDLSALEACCPAESPERPCAVALRGGIGGMREKLGASLGFVRRIAAELRPGVLDKLGLAAALAWLGREAESRTRLAVQVDAEEPPGKLDEAVALAFFRIAQEALTNIVRHAEASWVEIRLAAKGGELELTVRDDGRGLAASARDEEGTLGLVGMRERAALAGGRFAIESAPGAGTTIRVRAPLGPREEGADARAAG